MGSTRRRTLAAVFAGALATGGMACQLLFPTDAFEKGGGGAGADGQAAPADASVADTNADAPAERAMADASDSSTVDSGGREAAPDGGASDAPSCAAWATSPCPNGATWCFCDGFESGDFRRWDTSASNGSSVTLDIVDAATVGDASGVYAGLYALLAHAPSLAGSQGADLIQFSPTTRTGIIAFRARMLFEEQPQASSYPPLFYEISGDGGGTVWLGLERNSAASPWFTDTYSDLVNPGQNFWGQGPPVGSWFCVELLTSIAPPDGGAETLFADDLPLGSKPDAPEVAAGWSQLGVGMVQAPGGYVLDVRFDDVVLATFSDLDASAPRIGCNW